MVRAFLASISTSRSRDVLELQLAVGGSRKQVLLHAMRQYACSSASGRESSRPFVDTVEVSFSQRHFIPCIAILLRRREHRYIVNSYTIWILHPGSSCGFVDIKSSINTGPGAAVAFSAGSLTPPLGFPKLYVCCPHRRLSRLWRMSPKMRKRHTTLTVEN
jgi:hypothetical protein